MSNKPIEYKNVFIKNYRPSPKKFISAPDGDTIDIQQPIRLVSIDTPETKYGGTTDASRQAKLNIARERLAGTFYKKLPKGLRDYLVARLTPNAAANHVKAGKRAAEEFEKIRDTNLKKPDGKLRRVAVIPSGEVIDRYGRMLTYITTYFDKDELPPIGDPRRDTYNLKMVEAGWAAAFPIYPSFPSSAKDFNRFMSIAEEAFEEQRGMWREFGALILLGYEYRLAIKLGEAETAEEGLDGAFQRVCIDLRTHKNVGQYGFFDVPPSSRLWVWEGDVRQAKKDLGFT